MKLDDAVRKLFIMCQHERPPIKENGETVTPSGTNGVVKLKSAQDEGKPSSVEAPRRPSPSFLDVPLTRTTSPEVMSPIQTPDAPAVGSSRAIASRLMSKRSTVELEENLAYHPQGGPDYLKILAKYQLFGSDQHSGLVVCRYVQAGNIRDRQPQIIPVESHSARGNQEFLANIFVGEPPKRLKVDLDTGSADFWVFSTLLKPGQREAARVTHELFDPTKSRTWRWPRSEWGGRLRLPSFRRRNLTWDIEYGDGSSASGIVGYDDVTIGTIKLSRQAVQLAQVFRGRQFSDGSADGILGLAFGHLNSVQPDPVRTPLETMVEQRQLPERLFTVKLGSECFFTFGFIDEATRMGREIHWVDVDSRGGFWNFSSRYAKVGKKRLKRWGGAALADTGSTLILTHPHIVWMIYKQIEGALYDDKQPGWVYPIGARVPEVAFSVGDDEACMIVINEQNMHHSKVGEGLYFGAIQENPAYEGGGLQFDIFGTPFFRQVYAIFDIMGERFGVIKNSTTETPTPPICESPGSVRMDVQRVEEPNSEIEDSVDGSIREEYPRRSSTMRSATVSTSLVEDPIPEENEHEEENTSIQEPKEAEKQGSGTGPE